MTPEGDILFIFDAAIGHGDIAVEDRDLARDAGLETAVIISLFSNRRAEPGERLPDANSSREGWWSDSLNLGIIGSKLWLIERDKIVSEVIPLAEQYAKEALQWLITDGVASTVETEASRAGLGEIRLIVRIYRPNIDDSTAFTFYYNWAAQSARRG